MDEGGLARPGASSSLTDHGCADSSAKPPVTVIRRDRAGTRVDPYRPLTPPSEALVHGPADIPLVVMSIVSIGARDIERALFSPFRVQQDDPLVDRETEGFRPVVGGAL